MTAPTYLWVRRCLGSAETWVSLISLWSLSSASRSIRTEVPSRVNLHSTVRRAVTNRRSWLTIRNPAGQSRRALSKHSI